jgi:hypothetical protein
MRQKPLKSWLVMWFLPEKPQVSGLVSALQ